MGVRAAMARAVGTGASWVLRRLFHRQAGTLPGRAGLLVDPRLIEDLRSRIRTGSVVVVGTNGKTTVTNLVADALEAAGASVSCNRAGANLASGIAAALLRANDADWGVFECDELWLARVAPQLRPDFVVLLDLFRDQLDRMGEIAHIQQSIAAALVASPGTTLVYNADDPLCQAVADAVGNRCVPFGLDEDMGLPQNTLARTQLCQRCDSMLEYGWRQYAQLGAYRCPACGFARRAPEYAGRDVRLSEDATSVTVGRDGATATLDSSLGGAYTVYNLVAAFAASDLCGVGADAVEKAVRAYAPDNGRLQRYAVDGRHILLNLAKNPTGLNQSIRVALEGDGPKSVAFFINDNEADGHDVSWLWDADFEELASCGGLTAFAGGTRRDDVLVRLKYAGIDAAAVDGASDFVARALGVSPDARLYPIANYTAMPGVKAELDRMERLPDAQKPAGRRAARTSGGPAREGDCSPSGGRLVIAHLYPDLLNLYGDRGNVAILADRARRRGIEVEVVRVEHGGDLDLSGADIAFLGGGPDREQRLASRDLFEQADELRGYVEDRGVLLAICGGYQILGQTWLLDGESVRGLGILDVETRRAPGGSHNRLVGHIALQSPVAAMPVVGYENHAGRTYLGAGCEPFGRVIGDCGRGNNDADRTDGALYKNVVGTYLHGPLLAKNPEVADHLLGLALARRAEKEGRAPRALPPLDDTAERAANEHLRRRLGV